MKDASRDYFVSAMGFWLPCDQATFFHHDDDRELIERHVLAEGFPTQDQLDVSVFRRLVTVLPYKHYDHYFPVVDPAAARTNDPGAAVFVYENFGGDWTGDLLGHGAALIVNASGFYLWLALYSLPHGRPHGEEDENAVEARLKDHIYNLVGGDLYSHYSGLEEDKPRASDEDLKQSLKDYRDEHQGMLTFLQLNTILEGLYNSTLDFRVFFYTRQAKEQIIKAKGKYSIGTFIGHISTPITIEQRPPQVDEEVIASQLFPSAQTPIAPATDQRLAALLEELLIRYVAIELPADAVSSAPHMAHQLYVSYLKLPVAEHLLRRFLHVTASETLLRLKRRVERCRRALLEEMIEVTQRQQPLIQAESPDGPDDRIVGVNAAQLRGYIMLFSAKLPLIANVRYYLRELRIEAHEIIDSAEVKAPYRTWIVLLRSLMSDVRGLERALEQSRMDALVQEEEQMRREEETIAEIERLQERSSQSLEPVTTLAISVVSNVLALAAVLLALLSILSGVPKGKPPFSSLPSGWAIAAAAAATLLGLILIIAIYSAVQLLITDLLSLLIRVRKHERRRNDQYYYEMDMHLDRDIKPELARALLDHAFRLPGHVPRAELKQAGLGFMRPERNSYRVERNGEDEALHKVYIDVDMVLRRRHWRQLRRPRIHIVLVFEIMFHRPAQAETYIFQDVRVVSTTSQILTPRQIDEMKRAIAEKFVNPLIPNTPVRLVPEVADEGKVTRPADSLFSLEGLSATRAPATVPSGLVTGIHAVARRWPLPLLVYALGILASAGAFFATHPPAAVWSWTGLAQVSLFDTLLLVLRRQPGLFILPAVLALAAGVLAWSAVKSESLSSPRSSTEPTSTITAHTPAASADGSSAATDGQAQAQANVQRPLHWQHPALLALGALGLLGTLAALAGAVLWLIGAQ